MNFKTFMLLQENDTGHIGRFCSFALKDPNYPFDGKFIPQLKYLEEANAPRAAISTFIEVYTLYRKRVL